VQLRLLQLVVFIMVFHMLTSMSSRANEHVVLLASGENAQYRAAISGFQEALAEQRRPHRTVPRFLGEADGLPAEELATLRSEQPKVVTALGARAARVLSREFAEVPLAVCMVMDPRELEDRKPVAMVALEFPVRVQLDWLRRVLPGKRSVGVLYSGARNTERIDEARRYAKAHGLEIVAREIGAPGEIPGALRGMARRVDVLWGLSDPLVLSPQTAKSFLLFSHQNRIPLVGLSAQWVRAGALYALDRDYEDLGRQCGEAVVRVLEGDTSTAGDMVSPRVVEYSLNLRAAKRMRVDLPDALARDAADLIE